MLRKTSSSWFIGIMKSTKVQTLGAYCVPCVDYANARARKLATPHVSCNAWCCQFSLQHGLQASVSIVLGKAEYC